MFGMLSAGAIEFAPKIMSYGSQTWFVDFFRFQACMTLKKLRVENLADSKCKFIVIGYLYLYLKASTASYV